MTKAKLNVVIARYNESLEWLDVFCHFLDEYQVMIYVYNKGQHDITLKRLEGICVTINTLPNVGRESHTYLTYMIEYHDICAFAADNDITMFLQGSIDDHIGITATHLDPFMLRHKYIDGIIKDASKNNTSVSNALAHNFGEDSATRSFRLLDWKGPTEPAKVAFGEWFEELFCIPFPEKVKWWVGALFAVKTALISNRPTSFYQQVIDQVQTVNSEVCHYLERSWLYFFQQLQIVHDNHIIALAAYSDNFISLFNRWSTTLPLGFISDHKVINLVNDGFGFAKGSWYQAISMKIAFFIEKLETYPLGQLVLCSDVDIMFVKHRKSDLANYIKRTMREKDLDMLFLREADTDGVNGGFYVVKNSPRVRTVLKIAMDYCNRRTKFADQDYYNSSDFKNSGIKWDYIDNQYVAWATIIYNPNKTLFHHAVCTTNLIQKLHQQNMVARRLHIKL